MNQCVAFNKLLFQFVNHHYNFTLHCLDAASVTYEIQTVTMFWYVAIQLCIVVERLIMGDSDDLVVVALTFVHTFLSLLLMSLFTFYISIMKMLYLYENLECKK